jgi:hypothetical protein
MKRKKKQQSEKRKEKSRRKKTRKENRELNLTFSDFNKKLFSFMGLFCSKKK